MPIQWPIPLLVMGTPTTVQQLQATGVSHQQQPPAAAATNPQHSLNQPIQNSRRKIEVKPVQQLQATGVSHQQQPPAAAATNPQHSFNQPIQNSRRKIEVKPLKGLDNDQHRPIVRCSTDRQTQTQVVVVVICC